MRISTRHTPKNAGIALQWPALQYQEIIIIGQAGQGTLWLLPGLAESSLPRAERPALPVSARNTCYL